MNIVIIGGGLAGLTLARVLLINGIKANVYEAESAFNIRSQGGLLDIHDYNGQLAIKDANLYDEFLKIIIPGADAHRILDKNANLLHEDLDRGMGNRPEVDRGDLRQMLINSLPENMIHWGHKVERIIPLENGRHEIYFTNGQKVISDFLIGSDGAWSKVRSLVTSIKPSYIGTSFVEIYLYDIDQKHQNAAKSIGPGTLMALEPGRGILGHKDSAGKFHAYIAFNKTEEWVNELNLKNPDLARELMLDEFDQWEEGLRSIIKEGEIKAIPRAIYALPTDHQWKSVKGVTLIGDAAHLMSPFAGEGANLALLDGALLAKAIISNQNNLEEAILKFELEMFKRSREAAIESDRNSKLFFNEQSPQSVVDLFNSFS